MEEHRLLSNITVRAAVRRTKFGYIYAIEGIDTSTYAEYVSNHSFLGHVIKIWRQEDNLKKPEYSKNLIFIVGFPVPAAIKDGFLQLIESALIRKNAEDYILKHPNRSIYTGEVASWTIMTPDKRIITKSLDNDQKKMPLAYFVNATNLVEMIHQDWDGPTPFD